MAKGTIKTSMGIGDVNEAMMALIGHYGSEINLMSTDFYKKGKWSIDTKYGMKVRALTRETKELDGAFVEMSVGR